MYSMLTLPVLCCAFFTLVLKTEAAAQSGIYGIYGYGDLVMYTTNGTLIPIAKPDINGYPLSGQNLGCIDNINGIYYFIYQETDITYTGLYPYNLNDPTKQYSPIKLSIIVPNNDVGANDACTSDTETGDIYIWGHDVDNTSDQILLKINLNPSTGNATINTINTYNNICNGIPESDGYMATYDTKRDYLWLPGTDDTDAPSYFYIDSKTGKLDKTVESVTLDKLLDSALYDTKLDVIVGLYTIGRHNDTQFFDFQLTYFDPVTLETTKTFAQIDGEWCGWTPIYTQNFENDSYYQLLFKLATSRGACNNPNDLDGILIELNVNDGTITSQATICRGVFNCPIDIKYFTAK